MYVAVTLIFCKVSYSSVRHVHVHVWYASLRLSPILSLALVLQGIGEILFCEVFLCMVHDLYRIGKQNISVMQRRSNSFVLWIFFGYCIPMYMYLPICSMASANDVHVFASEHWVKVSKWWSIIHVHVHVIVCCAKYLAHYWLALVCIQCNMHVKKIATDELSSRPAHLPSSHVTVPQPYTQAAQTPVRNSTNLGCGCCTEVRRSGAGDETECRVTRCTGCWWLFFHQYRCWQPQHHQGRWNQLWSYQLRQAVTNTITGKYYNKLGTV